MKKPVYVILLAGGSGSRMGAGRNKVLLPVAGKICIARSANAFRGFADRMILVCRPEDREEIRAAVDSLSLGFPVDDVPGGETRQQSVAHGLNALPEDDGFVLVHDGARCLVDAAVIRSVLSDLDSFGSGAASVPVTDTVRHADENGFAAGTLPRASLRAMQTPQGFRLRELREAHVKAERDHFEGTDDVAVMEHAGFSVRLSEGSRNNIKLTTKEDLLMAEAFLTGDGVSACTDLPFPPFRTGLGYDVHQLVEGRKLILCGVEVPHSLGLLGHSDADVALHALMDALLGAAGLWDIGHHFPDSDPQYKGISSMKLLEAVLRDLKGHGFRPANVDITIVAQRPKLSPFIPQMVTRLAEALSLPRNRVNVKATTTERLGFEGRMEGISAQAVCMIQEIPVSEPAGL